MEHCHLRLVRGAVVALLVAVTPIYAEEETEDSWAARRLSDLFQLGNKCRPINLIVGGGGSEEATMGLTEEAIRTTVRSRLRAARLYSSESSPYLYVGVNTLSGGIAFGVNLAFNKPLADPNLDELPGSATTWARSILGQGQDAGYILSAVSQLTDQFIDAYLRVNESACSRSPIDP